MGVGGPRDRRLRARAGGERQPEHLPAPDARIASSFASFQVAPPSSETSTRAIAASPENATPTTSCGPFASVAPSAGRAITDCTGSTVTGFIFSGGTVAPGVTGSVGNRYAVCM